MRIVLIPHQIEHLAATFAWLTVDERLRQQIDSLSPPSSKEANEACWRKRWADANRKDFAIIANDRHVGNCGLTDIDTQRRKAQLWIYVGDGRGAGVGSSAVRKVLAYAVDELDLSRVYIRVLANNPKATAFYERLGFAHEGIFRHDTIQNCEPIDSYAMAFVVDRHRALSG
jgi:RimJ/RimL family protein N-acetyltransferase